VESQEEEEIEKVEENAKVEEDEKKHGECQDTFFC
jgi:hypothetical protein